MASTRRRAAKTSAIRGELIAAAEHLIREEGYAALTARTLGDRLNLSRQIVHYYFESMDELWIALVQHRGAKMMAKLEDALQSPEPLRAVWDICNDPDQAALSLELNALAHRRPAVRAEVKKHAEAFRKKQTQALERHLQERGGTPSMQPIVATVLLASTSQILALEAEVDITLGHKETLAFVDACLRAFAEERQTPVAWLAAIGAPAPKKAKAAKRAGSAKR